MCYYSDGKLKQLDSHILDPPTPRVKARWAIITSKWKHLSVCFGRMDTKRTRCTGGADGWQDSKKEPENTPVLIVSEPWDMSKRTCIGAVVC